MILPYLVGRSHSLSDTCRVFRQWERTHSSALLNLAIAEATQHANDSPASFALATDPIALQNVMVQGGGSIPTTYVDSASNYCQQIADGG